MDEERDQQQRSGNPFISALQTGVSIGRFLFAGGGWIPLAAVVGLMVIVFIIVIGSAGETIQEGDVSAPPVISDPNIPIPPLPDTISGAQQEILNKFGIDFSPEVGSTRLQWSWEVLNAAKIRAPRFFTLLGTGIKVRLHADTSERRGKTIFFSTIPTSFYINGDQIQYKILLIHELAHIIRGDPGSTQANNYDNQLQVAVNADGGYLTGYGERPCYGTTNLDEDFSETVTYYINSRETNKEEDLGCGIKSQAQINPLFSGKYPFHLNFIKSVLNP